MSINIADHEALDLVLRLARADKLSVIAKRPVANAAWRSDQKPRNSYHHTYWKRLRKLDYDFLEGDLASAIGTVLCFTLSHSCAHGHHQHGRARGAVARERRTPGSRDPCRSKR